MKPKVLIVGGGFAGVFAAKKLDEIASDEVDITLVSTTPHFELHANFYKIICDGTPVQACISLNRIFKNTKVNIVQDTITQYSYKHHVATGISGGRYHFDYAILALGSENAYFGIPGASNYSHSMRTIQEAIRLSHHIHSLLTEKKENHDEGITEIFIVGSGPSGVEIAGELSLRLNTLANEYGLDRKKIKVVLIEAMNQILPTLTPHERDIVLKRLNELHIELRTNTKVETELKSGVIIDGKEIKSQTVIWTAGAKANHLYGDWNFQVTNNGKVITNMQLQSIEDERTYIAGDGSIAQGSGLAWPAVSMGETAAINIAHAIRNEVQEEYIPRRFPLMMPMGKNWSISKYPKITLYGKLGYLARDIHIVRLLLKILPVSEVVTIVQSQNELCPICDTSLRQLDENELPLYN